MPPFFETKKLEEFSKEEWESVCDRCGKCCLEKLIDPRDRLLFTSVACKLLDVKTGKCRDYEKRQRKVSSCIKLTLEDVQTVNWLPKTCAYRLLNEGKELPAWHPLRTGTYDSVFKAGVSVANHACHYVGDKADWTNYIVKWDDL